MTAKERVLERMNGGRQVLAGTPLINKQCGLGQNKASGLTDLPQRRFCGLHRSANEAQGGRRSHLNGPWLN